MSRELWDGTQTLYIYLQGAYIHHIFASHWPQTQKCNIYCLMILLNLIISTYYDISVHRPSIESEDIAIGTSINTIMFPFSYLASVVVSYIHTSACSTMDWSRKSSMLWVWSSFKKANLVYNSQFFFLLSSQLSRFNCSCSCNSHRATLCHLQSIKSWTPLFRLSDCADWKEALPVHARYLHGYHRRTVSYISITFYDWRRVCAYYFLWEPCSASRIFVRIVHPNHL